MSDHQRIQSYTKAIQKLIHTALPDEAGTAEEGSPDEAAEELIRIGKENHDAYLCGTGYYCKALSVFQDSSRTDQAFAFLYAAMQASEEAEDYDTLSNTFIVFSILSTMHANYPLAVSYLLQAEEAAAKSSDPYWYSGMAKANLAMVYHRVKESQMALNTILEAEKMLKKNPDHWRYDTNLVAAYVAEGHWRLDLNDIEGAEKSLAETDSFHDSREWNWMLDIERNCLAIHLASKKKDEETVMKLTDEVIGVLQKASGIADIFEDIEGLMTLMLRMDKQRECEELIALYRKQYAGIPATERMNFYDLEIRFYEKTGRKEQMLETAYAYALAEREKKEDMNRAARHSIAIAVERNEILKEKEELKKKAETDSLTGLPNRYSLNRKANDFYQMCWAQKKNFAVEILDVDFFKQYNDTCGHQAGDRCLRAIADALRTEMRGKENIHAARYGGNEFAVLFAGWSRDELNRFAGGLSQRVGEIEIACPGKQALQGKVTISQGIFCGIPEEKEMIWNYLNGADQALYEVKRNGRGSWYLKEK